MTYLAIKLIDTAGQAARVSPHQAGESPPDLPTSYAALLYSPATDYPVRALATWATGARTDDVSLDGIAFLDGLKADESHRTLQALLAETRELPNWQHHGSPDSFLTARHVIRTLTDWLDDTAGRMDLWWEVDTVHVLKPNADILQVALERGWLDGDPED